MSVADGLAWNEEVAGASPVTLTIFRVTSETARAAVIPLNGHLTLATFWKAGRYKLAAPVSKTGSGKTEVGALPTPSANNQPLEAIWTAMPMQLFKPSFTWFS